MNAAGQVNNNEVMGEKRSRLARFQPICFDLPNNGETFLLPAFYGRFQQDLMKAIHNLYVHNSPSAY